MQDGFNVAGFSSYGARGRARRADRLLVKRGKRRRARPRAATPTRTGPPGPDYPALDQVDLESVLLHELGHMAGNKKHRTRCTNSPMIEALGAGEWWRGARDHWFGDCARARPRAASAGAFVHRVVRDGST